MSIQCSYVISVSLVQFYVFFFNDTATTEIYTLSLHDALPISIFKEPPSIRARLPLSVPIHIEPVRLTINACTRSEEHTSELQSHLNLVCRLLLEKKKYNYNKTASIS